MQDRRKIILAFLRLFGLLLFIFLLFKFFYYGKITLAGTEAISCEMVVGNNVLVPGQKIKVRPGSYDVTIHGKHLKAQKSSLSVLPLQTKSISCPTSNTSDEQLVLSLAKYPVSMKLLDIQYFENDNWLVAIIGSGGYADGTSLVVAKYTSSGWVLDKPLDGDYPNVPASISNYLAERVSNE